MMEKKVKQGEDKKEKGWGRRGKEGLKNKCT